MTHIMHPRIGLPACGALALGLALAGCNMRQQLKDTLGDAIMPPTPREAGEMAFNMYDADARREGVALLSASSFGGEPQYVSMYRVLLDDPDPTVRAVCLKALGEHGAVEDAATLIQYLQDSAQPAFVRWEAAKGLQRIHDVAAIDPLVTVLRRDEDASVRRAAADALGQYPQSNVFQALVGALDDADFGVTLAAHKSLATLTGERLGTDGARWLAWADQNRGAWFAGQQPYTVAPYVQPPGMMSKVQFWKKRPAAEPVVPTGLGLSTADAQDEKPQG